MLIYFKLIINPNAFLLCKKDTRLHNKVTTGLVNQCGGNLLYCNNGYYIVSTVMCIIVKFNYLDPIFLEAGPFLNNNGKPFGSHLE